MIKRLKAINIIKRLKAIIAELFVPSKLETDTASNRAYRRAVVAIAHCVLAAAIVSTLVFFSVPHFVAAVYFLSFYSIKEILDLFEGNDYADFFEDMIATAIGAAFALSMMLPVVAILIGLVVFIIHI